MTTPPDSSPQSRPISPHLTIYKWQFTMVMSILHRLTGVALAVGTFLLVAWICAAAYSPDYFKAIHSFFGGFIGKIMLFGWSVAFYYHLLNGVRHLGWDLGHGFEIPAAERTGWMVGVGCAALTIVTWIIAFSGTTGGAH